MALIGRPTRNLDSSVRSSTPHPASSVTSRWVVETGRHVSMAISVRECSLPSLNVSKIATTLLVTVLPGSTELPAIGPPFLPEEKARARSASRLEGGQPARGRARGQARLGKAAASCRSPPLLEFHRRSGEVVRWFGRLQCVPGRVAAQPGAHSKQFLIRYV